MLTTTVPGSRAASSRASPARLSPLREDQVGPGEQGLDLGGGRVGGDRALAVAQVAEQGAVALDGLAAPLPAAERIAGVGSTRVTVAPPSVKSFEQ